MVVNAFDIYDILTDIIPGVIGTLLLIILFFPAMILNQGLNIFVGTGGAILMIAIAYVVGRIIRNIRLWKYLLYREEASGPFERELEFIFQGESKLDDELIENIRKIMFEKYDLGTRPGKNEKDETDEYYGTHLLATVVPVGYSELYNRSTLYQRYTIISSLYESISTLFLLAAFGFWISGVGTDLPLIEYWPTMWTELWMMSRSISLVVIASLIIISFIGFVQYRVFDRRRAVAFVSDIVKTHHEILED